MRKCHSPPVGKKRDPNGLIIRGNFEPFRGSLILKRIEWLLGGLMLCLVVFSLIFYGVTLHLETDLNQVTKETRQLDEENKGLHAELTQLQSFEKVATLAEQVPHLHRSEESIDLTDTHIRPFPRKLPKRSKTYAPIYGY